MRPKAENLLLDEADQLKIADFGLAKTRDARLKQTTSVGTFSHMAPEVMRGRCVARCANLRSSRGALFASLLTVRADAVGRYDLSADLFSFGIVLTEALVGAEGQAWLSIA